MGSKGRELNLEVNIGGVGLRNPVVLCSGTAGYGGELKEMLNLDKIGAIVTKTITLKPKQGNPPPRIAEAASGILNSIGLDNPGLKGFLSEWENIKKLPVEIIVSIYGQTEGEFGEIISGLNEIKDIRAIELNLSCPNVKTRRMISQSPELTYSLIKYIRRKTPKAIIAKLTPEVTDIVKVARAAKDAGIDGLSLVNTFLGLKIDLETRGPFLGNIFGGLSGPAIKPLALYRVFKVYQELKVPIIASGGISDYKDALEFILCGAACVGIGTATFSDPRISEQILKDLISYMKKNNIYNLEEIRGEACA